jgi:hypothetical protein
MKFKIKLDDPGFHAEVTLDGYKTLNGDFLFDKHPEMDILINKKTSKVITFPKKDFGTEAYESQDRFLSFLVNKGIMDRSTIRSGNVANSLLGELLEPKEATMDNISICMLEIYNFLKKEEPYFKVIDDFEKDYDDSLLHPDAEHSTELGEVPHRDQQGSLPPSKYYGYGYGYRPYVYESQKREDG